MAAPLPIEQQFAVSVLKKVKAPVTKRSVTNLIAWMRAEGGHTHNNAKFNFLNTTQPMPGAGNTGSQGNIKVYRSFDQGVNATAQTLKNGRYGTILRSFNADPTSFASAVNSTPWGTKSNFGSIAGTINVSGNFANVGPTRTAQSTGPAPVRAGDSPGVNSSVTPGGSVSFSGIDGQALQNLLAVTQKRVLAGLMPSPAYAKTLGKLVQRAIVSQPVDPAAAQAGARVAAGPQNAAVPKAPMSLGGKTIPNFVTGGPIPGMGFHGTTHQTSGLAGYPAFDYMAKAGTPVGAPVSGKIFKLSGRDPKAGFTPHGPMGYSIYLQGSNGKKYYMTHLDRIGVKVGQRVRAGQQIAVVANGPAAWSSPHVHMGVNG